MHTRTHVSTPGRLGSHARRHLEAACLADVPEPSCLSQGQALPEGSRQGKPRRLRCLHPCDTPQQQLRLQPHAALARAAPGTGSSSSATGAARGTLAGTPTQHSLGGGFGAPRESQGPGHCCGAPGTGRATGGKRSRAPGRAVSLRAAVLVPIRACAWSPGSGWPQGPQGWPQGPGWPVLPALWKGAGGERQLRHCVMGTGTHPGSSKDTGPSAMAPRSQRPGRAPTQPLAPHAPGQSWSPAATPRHGAGWAPAGRGVQGWGACGIVGLWTVSGHRTSLGSQQLFPVAEQCPESCQGTMGRSTAPGRGATSAAAARPAPRRGPPAPCCRLACTCPPQREAALAARISWHGTARLSGLHRAQRRAAAPSCLAVWLIQQQPPMGGRGQGGHAQPERAGHWGTDQVTGTNLQP